MVLCWSWLKSGSSCHPCPVTPNSPEWFYLPAESGAWTTLSQSLLSSSAKNHSSSEQKSETMRKNSFLTLCSMIRGFLMIFTWRKIYFLIGKNPFMLILGTDMGTKSKIIILMMASMRPWVEPFRSFAKEGGTISNPIFAKIGAFIPELWGKF